MTELSIMAMVRTRVAFFLFALGLVVSLTSACLHPGRSYFSNGKALFADGAYGAAVTSLQQAVDLEPANSKYKSLLDRAKDKAFEDQVAKVSELEENHPRAALDELKTALKYKPTDHDAKAQAERLDNRVKNLTSVHVALADSLISENDHNRIGTAALLYQQVAQLQPESTAYKERLKSLQKAVLQKGFLKCIVRFNGGTSADRAQALKQVREEITSTKTVKLISSKEELNLSDPKNVITLELNLRDISSRVINPSSPTIRNSETVVAREQQLNPAYVAALEKYRAAVANYNNTRLRNTLSPTDNVWVAIAQGVGEGIAGGAVGNAKRELDSTPQYVEVEIKAPYSYKEYRISGRGQARIGYSIIDNFTGKNLSRAQFSEIKESSSTLRMGVDPNDAHGVRESSDVNISQESLRKEALNAVLLKMGASLDNELGRIYQLRGAALRSIDKREAVETYSRGKILSGNVDFQDESEHDAFLLKNLISIENSVRSSPVAVKPEFGSPPPIEVSVRPERVVAREAEVGTPVKVTSPGDVATIVKQCRRAVVYIESGMGVGSGFFVAENGILITNEHVVDSGNAILVHTYDGEILKGQRIASDPLSDLALVRVPGSYPYMMLRRSSSVDVGETVIAIGAPKGLRHTVTKGIVSQIRTNVGFTLIQHDAPINKGNRAVDPEIRTAC